MTSIPFVVFSLIGGALADRFGPRRFGKSLLVDTFQQLVEANEALFRGLAIHDVWDWSKKYTVVKIDFAGGFLQNEEDFETNTTSRCWTTSRTRTKLYRYGTC